MKNNKNLWILAFIAVINSLGFGIIVPLIYPFTKQFGINEQTIGLLTASFSIAQFFATPILGALSDRFGRKPVLILSLFGTCLSFLVFAWANSLFMLFAARILDGVTGGNISVAQAMISDSSNAENRTKNFGILSAAFGFGFMIGPAVGGILSEISLQAPFYFSAGVSLFGTLMAYFFLKETNPNHKAQEGEQMRFLNISAFIHTLKKPLVGTAIFTGFLLTMSQFTMIVGFQTFSVDVLKMTALQIGLFFAASGLAGVVMQLAGVSAITNIIKSKALILLLSLIFCFTAMFISGFTKTLIPFIICLMVYSLFNALRNPMLNSIISENITKQEQGKVLGVNQSFASIGQIFGPLSAGLIAGFSINYIFFLAAFFILIAFLFTFRLKSKELTLSHQNNV